MKVQELQRCLDILKTTDTALIVSPSQNEIQQTRQLELGIVPHRKQANDEALDDRFKNRGRRTAACVALRDVANGLRRDQMA